MPVLSPAAWADEQQALDQLLSRLKLAELRLHHMEQSLAGEKSVEKRRASALKLADAYAEQLAAAGDDGLRFAALQLRVEKLLAAVPEARTPALEVALLQADYQRAEALIIHWIDAPGDRRPLAEAAAILGRIAPLLSSRHKELVAAAEATSEAIESAKSDQERAALDEQARRQQAIASRACYFAGWSHYYLGVARQRPPLAQRDFAAAKEHFLIVLDVIDEKDYEPIDAEGLGLESVWRSRAAIGLGLAELGLHRPRAAAQVFTWLDHASVPPVIRDQAGYWQVQGMLNAGLVAEAASLVERQVEAFTASPTPGKSSLCITAIRAGAALNGPPMAGQHQRQQLIEQGLRGLARMRQFETLDKLIDQHKLAELADGSSFHFMWLRGRREYLAAEKSKAEGEFRAASETLSTALAHPHARSDLALAGQARYYLAWCQFRLSDLEAAARSFQEAATALRSPLAELAVKAAWMHCTCLVQLAAGDKRQVTSAIAALQNFKQDYPSSDEAARADLLITRLRQTHSTPEEAIRTLAAIGPSDPNYIAAQYEICQLQHQLWTKAKADPAKAAPVAVDLLKTADRFLASADKAGDWERRLKASLLAIDVLLSEPVPDQPRLASLLAAAAPAAENLDPRSTAVIEYQYRRLQLAQRAGDQHAARSASQWIAQHGGGSVYELPALVTAARAADEAVAAASDDERADRLAEAARVYSRLVELLGDSPAVLTSSKNALGASSKLAQYDEALEHWPQAADRLARLVEAQPSDRRLLRRAGIACVRAERHGDGLEHFRKLLAGLPAGSDDWFEAKYYQLVCLLKTDPAGAEKVFKQFKVLFPDIKSAAWREKFAELEKQFAM
jgi:tetratricopeptide (TPR) repeat protein